MTWTWDELGNRARRDLDLLASPQGWLQAGLPRFARLFGRDSAISALQVLDERPHVATATISALAATQGTAYRPRRDEQPGRIAHEVPVRRADRVRMELRKQFRWGFPYYGSVDATAWWIRLVATYHARTSDHALVEEVRPNLVAAARWMAGDARIGAQGFVASRRANRAGLEHQGWRDADMGALSIDQPVAMVEVQGYHERAVADLGQLDIAVPVAARGDRERFHRAFWMAEESTYALAVGGDGDLVRVVTSNPGHLLATPILTPARAEAVADRLFEPDLWSAGGVRTHSRHDRHFDADSYQRGSVWPHDNWVIHEGLRAIGRHDDAARVRAAVLDALCRLEQIPELYAVHGDRPVPLAVAQPVQAWSCGAVVAFLNVEQAA